MDANELGARLDGLGWVDTDGVLAVHGDGDGLCYPVVEVRHDGTAVVLVLGEPLDDCVEGSYGGAAVQDDGLTPVERRQTALQGSVAERAGLSDLHRP